MKYIRIGGPSTATFALSLVTSPAVLAQTDAQKALAGPKSASCSRPCRSSRRSGSSFPSSKRSTGSRSIVDEVPFDQYRQKSLVEMQQGTGAYDLYAVDVMWLAEYAAAGFLDPLMPYVKNADLTEADYDIDDFLPRVISGTGVFNDTLYTIPLGRGPGRHDLPRRRGRAGRLQAAGAFLARVQYPVHV